jgi:LytS/YehU family sensor histidine kinase
MKNLKAIAIWSLVFIFFLLTWYNDNIFFSLYRSISIVLGQFIVVKISSYFFDKYYPVQESKKFYIITLATIIGVAIISSLLSFYIIDSEFSEHKREITTFQRIFFPFLFNSIFYTIAFLINTYLKLIKKEKDNFVYISNLEKSKIETELKFLKNQINPHFLFNALNNIYTISYKGMPEAPNKILDLSDMLRYVLYDCKSDLVLIDKEIEYIENFIKFQQLKTKELQNIKLNISKNTNGTMIAPMILIPFIENSFKHSKIDKDKNAFVDINIENNNSYLIFIVKNSIPINAPAKMLDKNSGIGLVNVQKRLDLIYQNNYDLKIESKDSIFSVSLIIKTNDR